MKTIPFLMTITLLAIQVVLAGDKAPGEAEDGMKQAIVKERQRAEEAMQQFGNTKRFEDKYGWAKEKQPERYAALQEANRKATEKWENLARQAESATHPDALSGAKQAANVASSEFYLAELELKQAAAAAERRHMMEKSGSPELAGLAKQLAENERALLAANRVKHEATTAAEKLQLENRALSKAFQHAARKARDDHKDDDRKEDWKRDEDKDRPMPPKNRAPQID